MALNSSDDQSAARSAALFATTHWSVVLAAGDSASPESAASLDRLCRTYWYPLYSFVRRKGYRPEDAKDLTQGFFERLLEKHFLKQLVPARGRFRTFLLAVRIRNLVTGQLQATFVVQAGFAKMKAHFLRDVNHSWSSRSASTSRNVACEAVDYCVHRWKTFPWRQEHYAGSADHLVRLRLGDERIGTVSSCRHAGRVTVTAISCSRLPLPLRQRSGPLTRWRRLRRVKSYHRPGIGEHR